MAVFLLSFCGKKFPRNIGFMRLENKPMQAQNQARIRRLFIAEKPSLGRAIAEVLGVVRKGDGYLVCKNDDVITWGYGHLFGLASPEAYDPNLKKWNLNNLPFSIDNWILEKNVKRIRIHLLPK